MSRLSRSRQLTQPLLLTLIAASTTLLASCQNTEEKKTEASNTMLEVSDAYELAGAVELPKVAPNESEGLHNVYHLSDSIISGSEPHGEAAFAAMADMGVKTILSVDGKVPDAELAAKYGMRYVHVPIRYSGIEDDEMIEIAKTFREQDGPFYVHCFHGKHRGPAAAAVGRVVLDGAERERVVAEMRQWCGTSKKYSGLYDTLATKEIPTAAQTAAFQWDFPAAKPLAGFRSAMIEIPRLHDNIEILAKQEWMPDASHPDIDALNEARTLLTIFKQTNELGYVGRQPEDFRGWMNKSVTANEKLVTALENMTQPAAASSAKASASEEARAAFADLQVQCAACHKLYRDQ